MGKDQESDRLDSRGTRLDPQSDREQEMKNTEQMKNTESEKTERTTKTTKSVQNQI